MRRELPADLPRETLVLNPENITDCPGCDTVHSAALPASVIDRGQPGPGLPAQVIVSKVCAPLPLHRQQKIYARVG